MLELHLVLMILQKCVMSVPKAVDIKVFSEMYHAVDVIQQE